VAYLLGTALTLWIYVQENRVWRDEREIEDSLLVNNS
jgi:hypothetical protein